MNVSGNRSKHNMKQTRNQKVNKMKPHKQEQKRGKNFKKIPLMHTKVHMLAQSVFASFTEDFEHITGKRNNFMNLIWPCKDYNDVTKEPFLV